MEQIILPKILDELLAEAGVSRREMALRCEISPSTMRNIIDGQRCSPEVLQILSSKITEKTKLAGDRLAQFRLLFAHLHDEIIRAGGDPSQVFIRHIEGVDIQRLNLTPEFNADLGIIAKQAAEDDQLREVISDLAGYIARKEAQLADRSATVVPFTAPSPAPAKVAESPGAYPGPASADQLISNSRARRNQASLASSKSKPASSS